MLFAWLLVLPACSQEVLLAQQTLPQPPEAVLVSTPTPPAAAVPPTDPWAAYRSLLVGDTQDKQREIFHLGYRFAQEKNYEGARVFLSRALEVYPILADYSLYYLALVHREAGQTAEADNFFLRLLAEHPDSIWVGSTALALAQSALAESNWTEAVRYAEQARSLRKTAPAARRGVLLVLAQAREGQGDSADAYNLYQELRRTAPGLALSKTARARVEQFRALDPDRFALRTDQQYLDETRLLLQEGDGAKAEALATQLTAEFPQSPLQPELLSVLATAYKRQGRVDDAITAWKEITDRYPTHPLAPVALYDSATLLWNKDRDEEARFLFERVTRKYPHHERAADAWYAIGRIFQERKDDQQAAVAYQRLAALFPQTQLARDGRWRQAWMAYRRHDFRRAEQLFAALAKAAPDTPEGESALYWQARSVERLTRGETAGSLYRELLRRYPDGYYALWAEKRLKLAPSSLPLGTDGVVGAPILPPSLDTHYRRSQELRAVGLLGLARQELDMVKDGIRQEPAATRFLLAEYSRVQGYATALRFALTLARTGHGNLRPYLYPHAYWETVSAQARAKQLDPYFVLALIRQESAFDPEAVSVAHAYGLMQLLPKTAARVRQVPSVSGASLVDPHFNVETGTSYLRQLLDLYDGSLFMAAAAYNAGENAVDKWRVRYTTLEPDEFVESISFRETRNYVKQVLRNYRTYQRLYERRVRG